MTHWKSVKLFGTSADMVEQGFGIGSTVTRRKELPATFSDLTTVMDAAMAAPHGEVIGFPDAPENRGIGEYLLVKFDGSPGAGSYHVNSLAFLVGGNDHGEMGKVLRWRGSTVGALKSLVKQLELEVLKEDTEFRCGEVVIEIPLPLATDGWEGQ